MTTSLSSKFSKVTPHLLLNFLYNLYCKYLTCLLNGSTRDSIEYLGSKILTY